MPASDSESNMSGADVTITAVHPSPFRDPTTGDEFDGQEISFVPHSQRSPATPVSSSSDAEVPELSQPAASTEPQAERPRKKRHQRRVPPATKAPGSIGRQARDKTSRTSSVDRMEMGGALDAVLAQDSVDEHEDIATHSMCSEPASSAYPAVKTPGSSPRTEGYGSPRDKTPRFQVPKDQLARKPEPFVPPRQASDPRLRESSQHLETEHLIERDAIGGAVEDHAESSGCGREECKVPGSPLSRSSYQGASDHGVDVLGERDAGIYRRQRNSVFACSPYGIQTAHVLDPLPS